MGMGHRPRPHMYFWLRSGAAEAWCFSVVLADQFFYTLFMQLRDVLQTAHRALEEAKVDHALIGGMALGALGINRATADVDIIIDGNDRDSAVQALKTQGFSLLQQTSEVLHFEGIGFLDLLLANRPLSREMLMHATAMPTVGMKCLCPEDIIGLKIQAYMNNKKRVYQDKADIKALIERHPQLDWARIKKYADLFNQWDEIRALRDE
jgi:hypothetical protein